MSLLARIVELTRRALNPEFWGDRMQTAGYAVFGLVLFVIFLASNFPYGEALTSLLTPLNLTLTYQDQRSTFPLGAELDGVRLSDALDPTAPSIIQQANIWLRPTLGTLLLAHPGIKLLADLYGGFVTATLYQSGDLIDLVFEATDLDLGRYQPLLRMGVGARGRVSGRGAATLNAANLSAGQGNLRITVNNLMVRVARGLPAVRISRLEGRADLDNGMLRIEGLTGSGGDMDLDVSGAIHLAPDLSSSLVNLRVSLNPTPSGRTNLRFLFAMLPHPPGSRPYLLRGRLGALSIR